jgi:hypothetical protein
MAEILGVRAMATRCASGGSSAARSGSHGRARLRSAAALPHGKKLGAHRAHRSPGAHPLATAVLAYLTFRPRDAALRCIPGLPRLNGNGSVVRTACLPRPGKLIARSVSSVNNDETVTKFQL